MLGITGSDGTCRTKSGAHRESGHDQRLYRAGVGSCDCTAIGFITVGAVAPPCW